MLCNTFMSRRPRIWAIGYTLCRRAGTVGTTMTKTILTFAALLLGAAVALPSASWAQSESKSAAPAKASAQKKVAKSSSAKTVHKLAIQVAENNPQLMNLALNNARNV